MGDEPRTRHRAPLLLRERLIFAWWLAAPAFVTNIICAVLALYAKSTQTFLIGWAGACFCFYGWLQYFEIGRMPMGYRSLATELRWDLAHDDYRAGDKLPPIKVLATTYRTTNTTMLRAMKVLAAEGVIDVQQGRGTFFVGADITGDSPPRDQVERHMLNLIDRTFTGAPMPSEKALMIAYSTDSETVRSVRDDLLKRGLIRPTRYGGYVRT